MTTYDATIVDSNDENPTLGDDVQVIRTVTGIDSGQVVEKAWLTIKERYAETDAAAALQMEITEVDSADGQITDPGSGDVGAALLFRIADDDYDDLVGLTAYYYDIQLLLDDGVISTIEVGTVTWEREVTRARS